MKHLLLITTAAICLAGAASAQVSADQLAHDKQAVARAQAEHEAALRSHDAARIARTSEVLRAADENAFNDRKAAAQEGAPPQKGDTRASELRVIQARDAHEHALASGDKAAIERTAVELRAAEQEDYAIRHHQNHPG